MSKGTAISVKNVSKSFKLPHEKHGSLKSVFVNMLRHNKQYEEQHVLKDISFEVKKGEFFGIVGRNGSGKSTLLKLLAQIYSPDKGVVGVHGKLTPFIELGVGFNPELTGRENVYLNSALLGFSRQETDAMYKEIVVFAELEKFMDQKLKNYSSGMQVRLAFSIAIRAQSDILLIDEVLAVGDANFQNKCLDIFKKLKAEGRTIIFISHDMGSVRRFCDRTMMIKNGEIIAIGETSEIASLYEAENLPENQSVEVLNEKIAKNKKKIINKLELRGKKSKEDNIFEFDEQVTLTMHLEKNHSAKNVGVAVYSRDDAYVFGTNTIYDKFKIGDEKLEYSFNAHLGPGSYYLKIGVFGEEDSVVYEFFDHGPSFEVRSPQKEHNWEGIMYLDHVWRNK